MNHAVRTGVLIAAIMTLTAAPGCATPPSLKRGNAEIRSGSSVKYAKGVSSLGFAIQMGAFSDVKNAERFTTQLQAKGIEAFYYRKDNGIYAVRFGDFPSREKARAAANRLVADRLIESYYIAPPREVVFSASKPAPTHRPATDTRLPGYRPPAPAGRTNELGLPVEAPETARPAPPPKAGERDMGFIAARTAERFVGIPYQWGGDTVVDGMDCSGFTRAVYNLCGINIPRTSREQFKAGNAIPKEELRDGDLVFFGTSESSINHVGIYVGNGKFVHAPRRGEEIRTASIGESYFERRFVGARRYFQ
ncbi:NlpC/P60 family protein [Trichlorobacter ammonificans]|uniref:Cell wall-associated hydrolase, NlpC family n=1 Tax=Trichlorobacter ammonificans TaxID=2916410 RepID=A0ABM9DAP1_9BACT|nr:NlpC/P60 family protein [Trichlorobacter ammonificans]CAH2031732.1 Cell wall-associated hydrolase, NlpC family [Trichlorobacter ammonificans]